MDGVNKKKSLFFQFLRYSFTCIVFSYILRGLNMDLESEQWNGLSYSLCLTISSSRVLFLFFKFVFLFARLEPEHDSLISVCLFVWLMPVCLESSLCCDHFFFLLLKIATGHHNIFHCHKVFHHLKIIAIIALSLRATYTWLCICTLSAFAECRIAVYSF